VDGSVLPLADTTTELLQVVNLKTFPQGLDERTYVVVTVAVSFSVFGDHPDQALGLTTPAALNFAEMGKK
jgi:hypothetical protein